MLDSLSPTTLQAQWLATWFYFLVVVCVVRSMWHCMLQMYTRSCAELRPQKEQLRGEAYFIVERKETGSLPQNVLVSCAHILPTQRGYMYKVKFGEAGGGKGNTARP